MPIVRLPEVERGTRAVGPLLFTDGVFNQEAPLTPLQHELVELLGASIEGDDDEDAGAGRHAADPAETPVPDPVATVAPPEEVEAAATTEGSVETVSSEPDGSETTDAPQPAANQEG